MLLCVSSISASGCLNHSRDQFKVLIECKNIVSPHVLSETSWSLMFW